MNLPEPHELLGATFDCQCGRRHEIPIRKLVYSEDALEQLPDVLHTMCDTRNAVLVADERTWEIAGRPAGTILGEAGWSVRSIVVADTERGSPECDESTHAWLSERFAPADIALAVGSGVINDLTKWSASDHDLPYAVIATAASMNGYTAANVAPAIRGVKTLVPARPPLAVLAVPSILAGAPYELTAAGLGDTIAKPVSTADWLLRHLLCGDYFCRYCSELIAVAERRYLDHAQDIKDRKPAAIEALFNSLLYAGIAMTIAGTSAPASGAEHLLSHTLDMMSGIDGVAHDLHGRQVGVGTIFASAIYDRVFRIENPRCHSMPVDIDAAFWGLRAASVREQYKQKMPALHCIRERLSDRETWCAFIEAAAEQVRPPSQIKGCLKSAGAAHTFEDIGCSRERLLAAVSHMHEIRKRPTVVDLALMLGILPGAADEIVDTWLAS